MRRKNRRGYDDEAMFDREVRKRERDAARKRNVSDYFLDFSKRHRAWMQELVDKYKANGVFPMFPMAILPQYYTNTEDKEVAAFAALLIMEDGNFEKIQAFRELLGESPWKWFSEREFVHLSSGKMRDKRTGGVDNWNIARLMDRLWGECHVMTTKTRCLGYKQNVVRPIGTELSVLSQVHDLSYFSLLTSMLEDCGVGNYFYKIRLLLMLMWTADGMGLGVWAKCGHYGRNVQDGLLCPIAPGMRDFVGTWFPDWRRVGNLDDVIRLFGFERDCDFFYAYLGYKELQKRNPIECGKYATAYLRWYVDGTRPKNSKWRALLPEITF